MDNPAILQSFWSIQEGANPHAAGSEWYDDCEPKVSIIILNFNKSDLTLSCLAELWRLTTNIRYEIIVVDNGSHIDEFFKLAQNPGQYRLIRLEVNRFYGEGNNIGVEHAKGDLVCLLNNDAFATRGWLKSLCDALECEWRAGAVGPRFLYPDGRLQEVGAFIDHDGRSHQVGKVRPFDPTELENNRVVDYCSAACLLMRKADFIRVGGFDLVYEPAYYEDVDLCFKLAANNLFTYCCPSSVIVHIENATTATHRNVLGMQTVERNRQSFKQRWSSYLEARKENRDARPSMTPFGDREAGADRTGSPRPKVAFYSPYDLTPGGGERYLLSAAAATTAIADVLLVTEHPYSQIRLTCLGRELSLDLSRLRVTTRRQVTESGPVDVCVIMGNEILPSIRGFGLYNYYLCQFPFPIGELDVASRWGNMDVVDKFICYSTFVERSIHKEYRRFMGNEPSTTVIAPPVPQFHQSSGSKTISEPVSIVLIGRFFNGGHNKRHDVAIEAVKHLVKQGRAVELNLVGSVSPTSRDNMQRLFDLQQMAQGYPVNFHVNASADLLSQIVTKCPIYIHATGFEVDVGTSPYQCEHFGISVLEAMSAGCVPFVVNNGGPSGFVSDGVNGYQYADLDELVSKLDRLLSDMRLVEILGTRAKKTAASYSEAAFNTLWLDEMKGALQAAEKRRDRWL